MTHDATFDVDALRQAIGRVATASDVVTSQQCRGLLATLNREPPEIADGDEAPLAIHRCLAQSTVLMREFGCDGQPMRAAFLPASQPRRRMWAGGKLALLDALEIGDHVMRRSRIADVTLKESRAGPLDFVTIFHSLLSAGLRSRSGRISSIAAMESWTSRPSGPPLPRCEASDGAERWKPIIAAPLDGVSLSTDDEATTEADARRSSSLGFSGKLCVHPRQIAPVIRGFSPTASEIAWAEKIQAAPAEGAVAVDGMMVDAPVRQRARQILSRAAVTNRHNPRGRADV